MEREVRIHRRAKGEAWVEKIDGLEYIASSGPGSESYRVVHALGRFNCECKGFAFTGRACKHAAAVKHAFDPPPPPPERRRKKRGRRRKVVGTPDISCSHCTSKRYKEACVRPNLLRDAQVYTCLSKGCGRNFTHDDGFKYRTCPAEDTTMALGDRACGRSPHDIADSIAIRRPRRPSRSTLLGWNCATRAVPPPTSCRSTTICRRRCPPTR